MPAQRTPAPRPTGSELEILNVLWDHGPSTVRQVAAALNQAKNTGYTTVLKLMQIMTEKKLVKRDEQNRAHVYRALYPQQQIRKGLVKDLVERAFGGSTLALLQHALSGAAASREELAALRRLIEEQEKNS